MKMFVRAPFSTRSMLLAVAMSLAALAGCAGDNDGDADATGSASLALSLPASVNITTINYAMSGNGIDPITGTVSTAGTTVGGIPPGTNYLVEFTAASTDGSLSCTGKSSFDVVTDALTQVVVVMHCAGNVSTTGSVQVKGVWCPVLASYSKIPVGGQIAVTATATDLDTSDDGTPTFRWSASSGSFESATSASTKYTCAAAGTQTITITIGATSPTLDLSTCADSRSTTVTCAPPAPTCGNGVIDPGEQCEPPNTPAGSFATGCDATCKISSSLCATCEASKCDALFGSPGAWGCAGLTGASKASCEDLLTCIRTSHCAQATSDAQACYCGTASDLACLTGNANGACKAKYEAAAGTTDPGAIAGLFTDPSSPIGLADNEITCDADTSAPLCAAACPL